MGQYRNTEERVRVRGLGLGRFSDVSLSGESFNFSENLVSAWLFQLKLIKTSNLMTPLAALFRRSVDVFVWASKPLIRFFPAQLFYCVPECCDCQDKYFSYFDVPLSVRASKDDLAKTSISHALFPRPVHPGFKLFRGLYSVLFNGAPLPTKVTVIDSPPLISTIFFRKLLHSFLLNSFFGSEEIPFKILQII